MQLQNSKQMRIQDSVGGGAWWGVGSGDTVPKIFGLRPSSSNLGKRPSRKFLQRFWTNLEDQILEEWGVRTPKFPWVWPP